MTPFPKDDNKDHNPEIEQMIQDRLDRSKSLIEELSRLGEFGFVGGIAPWENNIRSEVRIQVAFKEYGKFDHSLYSDDAGYFPPDVHERLIEKALEYAKQKQCPTQQP